MTIEELESEVTALRTEVRSQRTLFIGLLVFSVLASIGGLALGVTRIGMSTPPDPPASGGPVHELVRAQRFEVVDERGQSCGWFSADRGTPQVVLLGPPTVAAITMDVSGTGPALRLTQGGAFALLTCPTDLDPSLDKGLFGPQLLLQDPSGVSIWAGAAAKGPLVRYHEADGTYMYGSKNPPR